MFREFFRFELSYWFRGVMVYVFLAVMALLYAIATGSELVQISPTGGNLLRNSSHAIATWYIGASLLTSFMAAAIYDSSASRDYANKMSDILFSKPLSKWGFLGGRFAGASLVALLPCLGVTFGILIANLIHQSDTELWGPLDLGKHLKPYWLFVIPNSLIFGSVVFAVASITRNTLYSFLSLLAFLMVIGVTQSVASQLDYEWLASWLDPLGAAAFEDATKYWTISDRNTRDIPVTAMMVWNRILWLGLATVVFLWVANRFRFETAVRREGRRWGGVRSAVVVPQGGGSIEGEVGVSGGVLGVVGNGVQTRWLTQFWSALRSDMSAVVFSKTFLIVLLFTLINVGFSLAFGNFDSYGVRTFPVTYQMVETISSAFLIMPLALITFFSGVLVWRDRDNRFHEILGATPVPNSVFTAARWVAMVAVLLSVLLLGIAIGVFYQWTQGYTRFQLGVYLQEMVGITGLRLLFLLVIGFVAHTLAPNKYVGYSLFVFYFVVDGQIWNWLRWDSLLVQFGSLPNHVYSDMFGIAPYRSGLLAFGLYWILVSVVLLWLCNMAMHRGVPKRWWARLGSGIRSATAWSWLVPVVFGCGAAGVGGWLAYNTMVLNRMVGSQEQETIQVEYERKYSYLANALQPKIEAVQYAIDIYPETRNVRLEAVQKITNKGVYPIQEFYLNVAPEMDTKIEIPRCELQENDEKLMMRVYRVDPPMQPGESLEMRSVVWSRTRGIENEVSNPQLVQNGTFFNNSIAPSFGYSQERRLASPRRRKLWGLEPVEPLPALSRECSEVCNLHYIAEDSDWVEVETVISTSRDQIAIAPGSLVEKWEEGGRNYYRYRVDHPSLNFYSFISAKYEVERGKVGDVDTEVYYDKQHPWNVPKMSKAIADTLEYCGREFGPYKHKQARIIEFPRVAAFAQAFPGTMPYSEAVGFIANAAKPDDIDMVTYIVAHEMGHQWWAHQVIGAKMQGATLLSETLAQYTALMVMRKSVGDDNMHKFMRYEMDRYLRSRGGEQLKERPLMQVELTQGYIHYQKGGIALYYLAEMIGEARINAALKQIIEEYAYKGPPYPNAYALVDRLREQTPEELRYLIKDLFEEITLFENKTSKAEVERLESGKYRVRLEVECVKKKADELGKETEVPMHDYLEIGAYAKPESGKRYGKLLHRERVLLEGGKHTLEFEVDEYPYEAGIDPRHMLIDPVPADNLKRVKLIE
jgi:ABC-type transport system involved in multi-copper enzyme maturation permease subunit